MLYPSVVNVPRPKQSPPVLLATMVFMNVYAALPSALSPPPLVPVVVLPATVEFTKAMVT